MRLLMIEDDARFIALIEHHMTCRWPDAQLIVHSPQTHGALSPEFLAQGFDAVLLAQASAEGATHPWLRELAARAGFAPVVLLSASGNESATRAATKLGAHAVLARAKIEHDKLIAALTTAAEKQ